MPSSLFQYEMLPTTWFYLSALIIVAVFFKFNRFWSVRNLDLAGLLILAPGLLFLAMNDNRWGYIWLFLCGSLFCVRMLLDQLMVRRPLLEPNLNPAGMTLSVVLLITFMGANVSINRETAIDSVRTLRLEQIFVLNDWEHGEKPLPSRVPGFRPFLALTEQANQVMAPDRSFLPVFLKEKAALTGETAPVSPDSQSAETVLRDAFSTMMGRPVFESLPPQSKQASQSAQVKTPGSHKTFEDSTIISASYAQVADIEDTKIINSGPSATTVQSSEPLPLSVTASPEQPLAKSTERSAFEQPVSGLAESAVSSEHEMPTTVSSPKYSAWCEISVITLIILGHIAIVIGLIHIGHCHFNNLVTGISAAMLYLLLPYVSQMTGRLDHLIPGVLIIWAVALHRRPLFAGLCLGGAASLVFHPIFLVPLWCSYYWKRGLFRFLIGTVGIILVFYLLLLFSPREFGSYGEQWLNMVGANNLTLHAPDGLWEDFPPIYRIPIMVVFFIYCIGVVFWPSRKHLATLMSCSVVILISLQFWQAHQGGLYMAWYLPLLIVTLFRPNLEDRVATATVIDY